ncbi:transcriptional regulator, GntR family [Noviherbaspirillum humi]|uniref:Transcriptional regulator, GntR family n=1 Tax=Noviherbaspirillum humi TaxID=1688639 RepID=A0A239KZ76_9BURK|nr:GntR family transcriptional regulator [Noviherbaspirillum humi]SNT23637.1 transcriptional regulator, GntR family [Noviherbaspirillum humi]
MKNRSETLRDSIEEMIATGAVRPGEHLDETELANRFGVSRTPIREALIQLASVGLIVIRPRRGAIVAEIPPQQLVEMFEVMAELEAMCGRLAARRMSPEEQQRLKEVHLACREAADNRDPDDYYYRNEDFHEALYAGSHNAFLAEQARILRRRLRPYRRLQLRVRDRIGNSFNEHQAIVDAIGEGNGERTAELLRGHIMIQGERFADLIAFLNQLAPRTA